MRPIPRGTAEAIIEAGHPVLAFLNTVSDDGKTRRHDTFETGEDLLSHLRLCGLNGAADTRAAGQLHALMALREAAYAVLSALAAGRRPPHEDRLAVETAIKSAMQDATLDMNAGRPAWRAGPMGGLHDHVALAIADFMLGDTLARLRECRRCTHLFLDHGRGTGRRWCSMARCGNRAKAQGFRDRRRAGV
ncbi:CGNR zinc finger domain-containing protein [Roseibacterium sp. SDUM158017]|uniref:CGNR zinc finger domain-containing protein n=1 Tax=Roseicyclus salinarum TaxID=3036773 RepID=UPI002414D63D|nr:ABATE domain-containing protein [Roseibacterium sp. SDUM158017]MDG4647064.1 CGNR zinc finger domain-containing protein [Roseibacterium sp. SDUM158017]